MRRRQQPVAAPDALRRWYEHNDNDRAIADGVHPHLLVELRRRFRMVPGAEEGWCQEHNVRYRARWAHYLTGGDGVPLQEGASKSNGHH